MDYPFILALLFILAILFFFLFRRNFPKLHAFDGNTLIVTAHPDDECMFFAPTILSLSNNVHQNLYILCLSNGNYYGLGSKRQSEFFASLRILGIPKEHCLLINNPKLQDGPDNSWDIEVILETIRKTVQIFEIKSILTFDSYGVSGHNNHCAIARAICTDNASLSNTNVLFLETVNICRKYLGIFDLLCVLCKSDSSITFTTNLSGVIKCYLAMYSHQSQLTWFRILYILSSRYVYINQFRQVIQ